MRTTGQRELAAPAQHRLYRSIRSQLTICYPAEHWIHLRTTNPIESTFATVRHRTKITRGPGSKAAGLAMAYKLIMAAQDRWRAVNAPQLVVLVRAGATSSTETSPSDPASRPSPKPPENLHPRVSAISADYRRPPQ